MEIRDKKNPGFIAHNPTNGDVEFCTTSGNINPLAGENFWTASSPVQYDDLFSTSIPQGIRKLLQALKPDSGEA